MTDATPIALISSSVGLASGTPLFEQWLKPVAEKLNGLPALVSSEIRSLFSRGPVIAYDGHLSMVRHAPQWRQLIGRGPLDVHIIGSGQLSRDADAAAIAAYLPTRNVVHHSLERDSIDLNKAMTAMRVDFMQGLPRGRRLAEAEAGRAQAEMNLHYVNMLTQNDGRVPLKANRQEAVRAHFSTAVGLAQDLVMRVPDFSGNPWWVIGEASDGTLYETRDGRLAYARVLEKLPDVSSALEVGCGSGFVTLFLAASPACKFIRLEAGDLTDLRVDGAKLLAELSGIKASFRTMSADALACPDKSFDVVHTCFVLEQCAEILDKALDECLRVARKYIVMFEPSMEAYPTLPGLIHIPANGFPTTYARRLMERGLGFSIIRPGLRHIYNPGAIYIVSVDSPVPPHVTCPDLLRDIAIEPL